MITVTIGNNLKRKEMIFTPDTVLKDALNQAGIDVTKGMTSLDGCTLSPADLNKTFAQMGYDGTEKHDNCALLNVAKVECA